MVHRDRYRSSKIQTFIQFIKMVMDRELRAVLSFRE